MKQRDFDPSRTVRTFAREQPGMMPGMMPGMVPATYINLPRELTTQPPRVMSAIRNTGVFAGLSGCGCSGKR